MIDPERWRRISLLYKEACNRPAQERRAFLESACGADANLRDELESLLASANAADAFFTTLTSNSRADQVRLAAATESDALKPGMLLGAYRIERLLGRGGMGAVFVAYDTKLHRHAAIKILGGADNATLKARLLHEARNAAALNHPNICTVYEVGDEDGTPFVAMEYVEGRPLRSRIDEGALPPGEAVRFGLQAAEGLSYAHDRGVVHRDFKAANLIVTSAGLLKIVDFGLARRTDAVVADASTLPSLVPRGSAAGTPYAMAPEQVRADATDARTDIWALGVLLYEMVSGAKPFDAPNTSDLFASILRDPPRPVPDVKLRGMMPVIERCLEKDPERRYQAAIEVQQALEDIQAGRPAASVTVPHARQVRRLAVLPFESLSRDPEQAYFVDGTHEALITDLARIGALRVIARTSTMRYKGTRKPLPEIARELNIDTVLTGSVLLAGERVRITAQLLDAATEEHLWAGRYERDLRDVLLLQNEIVAGIARDVHLHLTPQEKAHLASASPVNPEAYAAYLKGRFHWYKLSRDHHSTALDYFQLALEKDPNYALAHAGIAATWLSRGDAGFISPPEALSKGKAAITRALDLSDTSAEVFEISANLKFIHEWDWSGAEKDFRRAIALNPNYADAHFFYADFLISMRRYEEAKAEIDRALDLDPLSAFLHCFHGWHLVYTRQYDEAVARLEKTLKADPNFPAAHLGLWGAFSQMRMHDEAVSEARKFFSTINDTEIETSLNAGYAAGGYSEAMRRAAAVLVDRSGRTYVPAFRIARLYAHASESEHALAWLERAYERRETPLVHLSVGWDWEILRTDLRFQDLLRRMNLPA